MLLLLSRTYAFHLQGGEESSCHEHPQGDGENEKERQSQREGTLLDKPKDGQTHKLDKCKEMHPQSFHLQR